MKFYRLEKLINGYKVDPRFKGKLLVAFKEDYLKNGVIVFFDGKRMEFNKDDEPLATSTPFEDKFGRGDYKLVYFEWEPRQKTLF
jgi:hypothetical protein